MSSTVSVQREGQVAIVRMTAAENRMNPVTLAALLGAFDELEASDETGAVVLTGEGRCFSLGLDLEWMVGAGNDGSQETLGGLQAILARLLRLPLITVAAINGHAFAGGAILSAACDARVMRDDRGYWCLSEVDLGLVFPPAIAALLVARLSPPVAHEAMILGRRYTAAEALAARIVDEAVAEDRVLARSIEIAASLTGKPRAAVTAIKRQMYSDVLQALDVVPDLAAWDLDDAYERMKAG
jgi:enoyl-CoA hydratase/carnithine racemase